MVIEYSGVPIWKMEQIKELLRPNADTPIEREEYFRNPNSYMYPNAFVSPQGVHLSVEAYKKRLQKNEWVIWIENDVTILIYVSHFQEDHTFLTETVQGAMKGCETCVRH